jgi:hypothetical protein
MVVFNKKAFTPQLAAIKDKDYEMFRNKSGRGPAGADVS